VRDLPVDVIATVGPQLDPAELGPQPDNIRIERFIILSWTPKIRQVANPTSPIGAL